MKFVSTHANLKVILRSTIKYVANNKSGSEEVVKYPPIIIEFRSGFFDTSRWKEYTFDDIPEKYNIIKSEEDLIDQLKANPFFGSDYNEFKVESKSDKIARLREELAELGAEDDVVVASSPDLTSGTTNTVKGDKTPKPKRKPGPKPKKKTVTDNKDSVTDL